MPERQKDIGEQSDHIKIGEKDKKEVEGDIAKSSHVRRVGNKEQKENQDEAELGLSNLDSSMPWTEKGFQNSTLEQLSGVQKDIQLEIQKLQTWKNNILIGSLLEKRIERREEFLNNMLNKIEGVIMAKVQESNKEHKVLINAKRYLGIHEDTGGADKFLMGQAKNAKETPWCAGFVSYILQESGYRIPVTLSSKKFIGESGLGHVAFYVGNGQILGGNQDNQVSVADISRPIKGWIMPEELEAGKSPHKGGEPNVGAIVVFDRRNNDHRVT